MEASKGSADLSFLEALNKWRNSASPGENRTAVFESVSSVNQANGEELMIKDRRITSLPPVPPSVTKLNIAMNRSAMIDLPENLFNSSVDIDIQVEHLKLFMSFVRTNGHAQALFMLGEKYFDQSAISYCGGAKSAFLESNSIQSRVSVFAWIYFEKAAAAGRFRSYNELIEILKSPELAMEYLKQAAVAGSVKAYKELRVVSLVNDVVDGVGREKSKALYKLILELEGSEVTAEMPAAVIDCLKSAADKDHAKAAYELARILKVQQEKSDAPNYHEVKKYLKIAVKYAVADQELKEKASSDLKVLPKLSTTKKFIQSLKR